MSETEKMKTEKDELTGKLTASEQRALNAEKKLEALTLNVDPKYIDDVIGLVPDGEDPLKVRMKAFLEERPIYLKKSGSIPENTETKQQTVPKEADAEARIRKSMGLDK